MTKSDIEAQIAKVEAAIAAVEDSIAKAREKAAEIETQFNDDCVSLASAYESYTSEKTSAKYDVYAVIYQRLFEAKGRHDGIRFLFEREKTTLKVLRKSLRKYQRMLASGDDDSGETV